MKIAKLLVSLSIILILISCQKQTDLRKLRVFDLTFRKFEQINEFGLHIINGEIQEGHFETDSLTIRFIADLEKLKISKSEYIELKNEMRQLGIITCIKTKEYSIYITGGSFARIYGYLINHSDRNYEGEFILASGRYNINVGKEIENKIYPIWTD
jgi:hypothetical protein